MLNIPKRYQVDENGGKTAVILDIEVYQKLEKVIEQNGLRDLVEEVAVKEFIIDPSTGVYNRFG